MSLKKKTGSKQHRLLYSFLVGDVEDPDILANFRIQEWLATREGRWCELNAEDLRYNLEMGEVEYHYRCRVYGSFNSKMLTAYELMWNYNENIN